MHKQKSNMIGRAFGMVTSSKEAIEKMVSNGFEKINEINESTTLIKTKNMSAINQDSIMPIGQHKGQKMKDVPDNYLLWYYNEFKGHLLKKGRYPSSVSLLIYIEGYFEGIKEDSGIDYLSR